MDGWTVRQTDGGTGTPSYGDARRRLNVGYTEIRANRKRKILGWLTFYGASWSNCAFLKKIEKDDHLWNENSFS